MMFDDIDENEGLDDEASLDWFGLISAGTPVPLIGVAVTIEIRGASVRMVLAQRYRNVESVPIEAVYAFPVDERTAVCGFEARIGEKRIVAEVCEREEAFKKYDTAMSRGHGAYLLDEERADVFVANVGNLLPDQEVELRITTVSRLDVEGSAYRLTLPTTVAPRYAPAQDRRGVGQTVEEVLNPPSSMTVPYGLQLEVKIEMPSPLRAVTSLSHPISVEIDGNSACVTFSQECVALDRDFVLTLREAKPHEPEVIVEEADGGNRFVSLSFIPHFELERGPCECIFVLDSSGSMQGSSLLAAKETLALCLQNLPPDSFFNVVVFGSSYQTLFPRSMQNDAESLARATEWLRKHDTDLGGTEILEPLTHVLTAEPCSHLVRQVFLITDGEVSNTDALIALVAEHAHTTRVFAFGIGEGPSRHLVRGLARAGRGAAEFVLPGERIQEKVLRQFERALRPALTNIAIDWQGADVDLAPCEIPPVFSGDPFLVYARIEGNLPSAVTLRFETLCGAVQKEIAIPHVVTADNLVQTLWARERIRDLEEGSEANKSSRGSRQGERRARNLRQQIIDLAVRYGLSSRETSFIAVEKRTTPTQELAELRRVPIALTHGWGREMACAANSGALDDVLEFGSRGDLGSPLSDEEMFGDRQDADYSFGFTDAGHVVADPEHVLAEVSVYLRYNKHEKAVAPLKAILQAEPEHRGALEMLGDALVAIGEEQEALQAWAKAAVLAKAAGDSVAFDILRNRIAGLDENAAAILENAVREQVSSGVMPISDWQKDAIQRASLLVALQAGSPSATWSLSEEFAQAIGIGANAIVKQARAVDPHSPRAIDCYCTALAMVVICRAFDGFMKPGIATRLRGFKEWLVTQSGDSSKWRRAAVSVLYPDLDPETAFADDGW